MESKKKNQLILTIGDKLYTFYCGDDVEDSTECDNMISTLAQNMKNIFPNVPFNYIIRKVS